MTQQQAGQLLSAAYAAEVDYRGMTCRFDESTKNNIIAVAKFITDDNPKSGILLCGNPGNGKTTMMLAFRSATNYLVRMGVYDDAAKVGLTILDARDITVMAKNYSLFDAAKKNYMLGIEDIGREPTEVLDFGNVINPIIDMLEYRYREQLFTFITTNLTPRQVREKYGNRIADRLNEMVECIVFEHKTYRR